MKNLISIIIPVYNLEEHIEKTVQSIIQQTYKQLEIILVDDGSTDRSLDVMQQFAKMDSRIKTIHQENTDPLKARIIGILSAHGEWIGFVDGDDEIEPDMYERLLQNVLRYHVDISHCGYKLVSPTGEEQHYGTGRIILQDRQTALQNLIDGKIIKPGLWNKLYHHRLFNKIPYDRFDYSIRNY